MRLYLDHNVSHGVVAPLGRAGHDVMTSRAFSAERLPDDAQLLAAVRMGRVLVTHNRADFRMLHDAWVTWPAAFGLAPPPHPGILILDSGPPSVLAAEVAAFLEASSAADLGNALFWWRRRDGWRQPGAGVQWEPLA